MNIRRLLAMLLAASLMISPFALGEETAEMELAQEKTASEEATEAAPEPAPETETETAKTPDAAEAVETVDAAAIPETKETEISLQNESPELSSESMIYIFESWTADIVDEPAEKPTEELTEKPVDSAVVFTAEPMGTPDEPAENITEDRLKTTVDSAVVFTAEPMGTPDESAENLSEVLPETTVDSAEVFTAEPQGAPDEPAENITEEYSETPDEPAINDAKVLWTEPAENKVEEKAGESIPVENLVEGEGKVEYPGTSQTQNTKNAVKIYDLTVTPVSTNDTYSTMTFSFTEDGREYTCVVTGLANTGNNTDDAWKRLAEDIAEHFLTGKTFTLSESGAAEDYGLDLDLIDAEKVKRYVGGQDSEICWAASASDMLEYAGWNLAEDEDEAFNLFRDEFYNRGGTQEMGISWYLDGVNTHHAFYGSGSGDASVTGRDTLAAAQQKNADSGGFWNEYAAASLTEEYDENIPDLLEEAADLLTEGYGVGLGAYFYRGGEALAGHALTLFGYIREKVQEGATLLRALFVADSDNRADGSQSDPSDYPDEYTMYHISSFDAGDETLVRLEGYHSAYTTAIGLITTLVPKEKATEETEGTKEPLRSPNLTPKGVRVEDGDGVYLSEAEAGTTVNVGTEIRNQSYKGIPGGSIIRYAVDIYVDGELVDTVEKEMIAEDKIWSNETISASTEITLDRSGEYTFTTRIISVTDASGKPIEEAYLSDNTYSGSAKVTVHGGPSDSPENPEVQEEIIVTADGRNGEKPEEEVEIIYTLEVVLAADTEYLLDFEAGAAVPESFTRLRNRRTGDTVDPENYTIVLRENGGFTISFGEHFIRTLKPGRNDFALSWKTGRVLLRIIII